MHTEHLQNVRPIHVATGWLVAAAATSLVALVLASLELVGAAGTGGRDAFWTTVAVALGFWVGGLFTGFRAPEAPILHGIGIGLASLVAWVAINVLLAPFPESRWEALTPTLTAALLLVQMISAVAGAWLGYRIEARGDTGMPG